MKIKAVHDHRANKTWLVRLVEQGDAHGRGNVLTHQEREPLVEFFDPKYPHTDLGQFVSSYYLSTLLASRNDGLMLDTGSPSWQLSAQAFADVQQWLKTAHNTDLEALAA